MALRAPSPRRPPRSDGTGKAGAGAACVSGAGCESPPPQSSHLAAAAWCDSGKGRGGRRQTGQPGGAVPSPLGLLCVTDRVLRDSVSVRAGRRRPSKRSRCGRERRTSKRQFPPVICVIAMWLTGLFAGLVKAAGRPICNATYECPLLRKALSSLMLQTPTLYK